MRTALVSVTGFAVAAALAFLAGAWIRDPATPPAQLPPLEATEQVVIPVVVDPDADLAAIAIEAADQEVASREIASDLEIPVAGDRDLGAAGVAGSRSPADPETGEPGEPAIVDPADWPPSDTPPAADVAIDECADGGDDCPEGVGGTILLEIRAMPPLEGVATFNPPESSRLPYAWSPECPPMDVPGGSAYFAFVTSRPAVIEFRYRAYPWARGSYFAEGELEFVTPDAAEGPWNDWIADDTAPSDDPRSWITHCILIPDLPASADYVAFISYRDKYDPAVTASNWRRPVPFEVADDRGFVPGAQRRPTFLLGYGIDDLRVGLTRAQHQTVEVVALPGGAPGDCNTGGDEGSLIYDDDAIRGRVISEQQISEELLTDPTYPYFPDHDMSVVLRAGLQEGTDYLVCIYWLGAGPTFDSRVVEIAEEALVSTPEAYRPRFRFHGVTELFGEIDAARVGVWPCGLSEEMPLGAIVAGADRMLPEPETLCTAEEDLTRLDQRGIQVSASVHDSFEDRWLGDSRLIRSDLECGGPCRIRMPEMALIPLPEVPTERRLCGTGFGDGCDGEVPMRSAGFAVMEIQYIDVPGNGLARWSIGEAAEFEDSPLPPEGETPLLDPQVTYVLPSHPTGGAAADVTVVADRPVTLSASIASGPDCGLGDTTVYVGDTLATTHVFRIAPLCLGNNYELEVVAFDEGGAQGTIVDRLAGQVGSIDRMVVPPVWAYLDISVTIPSPDSDHLHSIRVRPVTLSLPTVDPPFGTRLGWAWPLEDRIAASAEGWQMYGVDGQANACGQPDAGPLTVNGSNLSWGTLLSQDQIQFRLEIDVHENHEASAVYSECAVMDVEVSHVLQATLTLEDLFAGVTITSDDGAILTISVHSWRRELVGGI
ncbi:MAG TPA: hypothetical protein VK960_01880 [Acidimicrobiia bacterium]|nr:hypothetical protein [Acidimicrobiia bacterium]